MKHRVFHCPILVVPILFLCLKEVYADSVCEQRVLAVRDAAIILIGRGWTQGAFARDADGTPVRALSSEATRHCLAGAITAANDRINGRNVDLEWKTFTLFADRWRQVNPQADQHEGRMAAFNDLPSTTQDDVIRSLISMVPPNCGGIQAKPSPSLAAPKPKPPKPTARKKSAHRITVVNQRFTGCFDAQEVVRLHLAFKEVRERYGLVRASAVLDSSNLAKVECCWLEEGDLVRMIGNPYNAIVGDGTVIEGITVLRCADSDCKTIRTKGIGGSGLWFPVAMLTTQN